MKKFEVEMDIHFTKAIHIEAPDEDSATVLAETILLCTDALPLTDADMVGLITTAAELGKEPVCKTECTDEDDDDTFCSNDCNTCDLCDEGEEADFPTTSSGKRMSFGELMLHLSDYLEDAEDELDEVRSTLYSIEKYARAMLQAKNEEASEERMRRSRK